MAFGGLKGTLTGNGNSIGTSNSIAGSVVVAVGDLVFAVLGQQTNLTATGATDNLGNTYAAQNAGTDAGAATGRAFYSRVTVAGTLTSVAVAASSSTNDWAGFAAVIEGPIAVGPIDANPANATADLASPFTCPATGTLGRANEIIIAWMASDGSATWLATSPNLKAGQAANSTNIKVIIGYQAVSSTSTVSPEFSGTNPGVDVLGTASFKQAWSLTAAAGSFALTGTAATPKIARVVSAAAGSYSLTGTIVTLRKNLPLAAGAGSYSLTGTAASLLHQWKLPAAAGSYAVTGTLASLSRGALLSVDAGAYILSGAAAALEHDFPLLAEAGSYALTGTAAGLTVGFRIAAAAGIFTLAGAAAAVIMARRIVAGEGIYSLVGVDAALTMVWTALPDPAAPAWETRGMPAGNWSDLPDAPTPGWEVDGTQTASWDAPRTSAGDWAPKR